MSKPPIVDIEQCGRKITFQEIEEIIETVESFPNLCLTTLTETICEHLKWYTATGRYKIDACRKLLQKLEAANTFTLPEKHSRSKRRTLKPKLEDLWEVTKLNHQEIHCDLQEVQPVSVKPVSGKAEIKLWDQYVERYHYLGHKHPFGCFMRYFAKSAGGEILACVLFAGAAKSISARDKWIGWSNRQRLRNLPWVINNTRFAIMPWAKIPCLGSHILGQIGRRITKDWQTQWGYRPLLMETFVDPLKYSGTCYKASNWIEIGRTTGEGLARKGKRYTTTPKLIFARPLVKNFREQLSSEYLEGRVDI